MSSATAQTPGPRPAAPLPRGLRRTFAALGHRNYRLWFCGQFVSLFGTWMQATAQGYLVYELTHSPAYLGYVAFANGLPSWIFTLYGGVVSDRVQRRSLLLVTQWAMLALAAILAGLTFTGLVQPWHIIALALLLGLANAFDAPARQALVSELVTRDDLTNAIALNATMFNMATAVGPAAAGLTYDLLGPAWCFIANALSFLGVIAALMAMRLVPRTPAPATASLHDQMTEGVRYVLRNPVVRTIILLIGLNSGFGFGVATLLPAWAVAVLHGNAATNGLLLSARGLGAVLSALCIASLGRFGYRGRLLTAGTILVPVCLLFFAASRTTALSLLAMALTGSALIIVNSLGNALVQTTAPDALRGRVMGVYTLTFFGSMPMGSLVLGLVAQHAGEPAAVVVCAAIIATGAATAWIAVPAVRAKE